MIVTCPSCAVRYLVDPRAIGAKGRKVRCARCSHTWHQDADPTAFAEAAATAPPPPSPVPAAPPAPAPPPVETRPGPRPVITSEDRINLPAVPPPKKRRWGPAIAWLILVIVLIGAGWGAVIERSRIISLWPAAGRVFAYIGFPGEDSGLGLELRNVTPNRGMENGLPALIIDGEVMNVSPVVRAVPKLKVTLRDRSEHELQNWTFSLSTDRLLPGQSAPFHTSIAQPAEAATDVVVTFAAGS